MVTMDTVEVDESKAGCNNCGADRNKLNKETADNGQYMGMSCSECGVLNVNGSTYMEDW